MKHALDIQVSGFEQKPTYEQLPGQLVLKQLHCPCGIKSVEEWSACPKQKSTTQVCAAVLVVTEPSKTEGEFGGS